MGVSLEKKVFFYPKNVAKYCVKKVLKFTKDVFTL